jgi:hypothetical protein
VKKTEAIKMTDELRTCKQDLLEKLIEEQKKIILKMEEKRGTLKSLNRKIDAFQILLTTFQNPQFLQMCLIFSL